MGRPPDRFLFFLKNPALIGLLKMIGPARENKFDK